MELVVRLFSPLSFSRSRMNFGLKLLCQDGQEVVKSAQIKKYEHLHPQDKTYVIWLKPPELWFNYIPFPFYFILICIHYAFTAHAQLYLHMATQTQSVHLCTHTQDIHKCICTLPYTNHMSLQKHISACTVHMYVINTCMYTPHCWAHHSASSVSNSQTGSSGRGEFPARAKNTKASDPAGLKRRREEQALDQEWKGLMDFGALTIWIFSDAALRTRPQKCRSTPWELLSITWGIWGNKKVTRCISQVTGIHSVFWKLR